jgi:hypothetical protein
MATRWAYEAISVEQFKSNGFEKPFFRYDMEKSQNNWYATFLIPDLKVKVNKSLQAGKDPVYKDESENNLVKLNYHINDLAAISGIKPGSWLNNLTYNKFNDYTAVETLGFLDSLRTFFRNREMVYTVQRDSLLRKIESKLGADKFLRLKERDYNDQLAEIVLNRFSASKIYEAEDKLIQKADPVFMKPGSKYGRAHFFAPYKQLGNLKIGTLYFNIAVVWIMIAGLFVTLYYNILNRFIIYLESLRLPFWRKFGRDLLQI